MEEKKCYIAGKISNLPKEEYLPKFENAKQLVKDLGFIPISPTDLKHDHDKSWLSYMREDLKELLSCEAVYALNNWRESKGAKIEIELALRLGLKVYFQL